MLILQLHGYAQLLWGQHASVCWPVLANLQATYGHMHGSMLSPTHSAVLPTKIASVMATALANTPNAPAAAALLLSSSLPGPQQQTGKSPSFNCVYYDLVLLILMACAIWG